MRSLPLSVCQDWLGGSELPGQEISIVAIEIAKSQNKHEAGCLTTAIVLRRIRKLFTLTSNPPLVKVRCGACGIVRWILAAKPTYRDENAQLPAMIGFGVSRIGRVIGVHSSTVAYLIEQASKK
jgi:hypothetical protein